MENWQKQIRDKKKFRPNVAIIVMDSRGRILVGKRRQEGRASQVGAWQLPQGGINKGESPLEAMYRELAEETGLTKVSVVQNAGPFKYQFPLWALKPGNKWTGQEQIWFLTHIKNSRDKVVKESEEFTEFKWVKPSWMVQRAISFKRPVYRKAFKSFGLSE